MRKKSLHFHPHNEPRTRADPHKHAKALTRARQTEPAGKTSRISLRGVINLWLPGCTYSICSAPSNYECLSSTLQAKISVTPSGPTHSYHHAPTIFLWSKLPRLLAVTQRSVHTCLSCFTDVQLLPSVCRGSTARLWEGHWAQLRVSWVPWVQGAVKELCSSLLGS